MSHFIPAKYIVTLSDKTLSGKTLSGKNLSGKNFVGQKFRHLVKFSSLLSENMLNSIVLGKLCGQNYSSDKTFRRTEISSPSQNFVSFVRQSYIRYLRYSNKYKFISVHLAPRVYFNATCHFIRVVILHF